MMKKILLSTILFACLCFSRGATKIWAATLWTDGITADGSATFSGGTGTVADPYLLSSTTDLVQLAVNVNSHANQYPNKYFLMTTNIDLAGKTWVPIGYGTSLGSNSFQGHFDGGDHVVNNMMINRTDIPSDTVFLGFFGWVYSGNASISNLGLTNAQMTVTDWNSYGDDVGLLVGYADNGVKIDRCFAQGKITATVAIRSIGGLVGQTYSGATINNCYFMGEINSVGGSYAAGIVGYLRANLPANSYVVATVNSTANNQYIIGSNAINSYYDSEVANLSSGGGAGRTTAAMKTAQTATDLGVAWQQAADKNSGYPYLFMPAVTVTINNTDNHATVTEGGFSAPAPADPPVCGKTKPTSEPDLFQVDVTNNQAKIFFTPVQGFANEYLITFGENEEALAHSSDVQLAAEGVQSYDLYYLQPNTTYYLKVAAKNNCAVGDWSNTLAFTTTGGAARSFYRVN